MMLRSLKRTFSNSGTNQKTGWLWRSGDRQSVNQHRPKRRHLADSAPDERLNGLEANSDLRVEGIEVTADKTYMYCKGCVRSRCNRSGSRVVVAVEWLDADRNALNTDWKRIGTKVECQSEDQLTNMLQPFTVRAPLDRRVKWVQAYAFSGDR